MSRIEIFKYLRWILAVVCVALALICLGLVPYITFHLDAFFPGLHLPLWWLLPCFYGLTIPVFISIWQAFAICGQYLRERRYSEGMACRLLNISRCALMDILLLILLGLALLITKLLYPWLFILLVMLLFVSALVAMVAAVFAGLLRKKVEEQSAAQSC